MKRAIETDKTLQGRPFELRVGRGGDAVPGRLTIVLGVDGRTPPKVLGAPPLTGDPATCRKVDACFKELSVAAKESQLGCALAIADGGDCEDALDRLRLNAFAAHADLRACRP